MESDRSLREAGESVRKKRREEESQSGIRGRFMDMSRSHGYQIQGVAWLPDSGRKRRAYPLRRHMDKCKTERVLEGVCATPQNTVLRLRGWRGGGLIHGIDIGGAVHEQPHDVDVPKPRGFHQGGRPILSARWRRRREAHMKTPAATWSR